MPQLGAPKLCAPYILDSPHTLREAGGWSTGFPSGRNLAVLIKLSVWHLVGRAPLPTKTTLFHSAILRQGLLYEDLRPGGVLRSS